MSCRKGWKMNNRSLGAAVILVFAWVLWGNGSSFLGSKWRIYSGHASLNECRRAIPGKLGKLLKLDGAARQDANKVFLAKPTDDYYGETTLRLVCLPENVDPRKTR